MTPRPDQLNPSPLKTYEVQLFTPEGAPVSTKEVLASDMRQAQAKADRLLQGSAGADYYQVKEIK